MLACKPVASQIRDLKPGQVARERGSLLALFEDAYLPWLSGPGARQDLCGLEPVVSALITILKAGEKKPSVKPSEVRAAIEVLRSSQASIPIARSWLGAPSGRQMVADAELCTKKTASDSSADLLLKKSIEHEGAILNIIPPDELGCMEVPRQGDLNFLGSRVSLAQCQQMLQLVQASSTKLLEALQKWSPTGMEEQSGQVSTHCDNLIRCMFAVLHRVVWGIDAACRPALESIGDQPRQLDAETRAQSLKQMAEATTKFQKELIQDDITAKFGAVVKALATVFETKKQVDLQAKVQRLGVQYDNSVKMLSLASAASDLGTITEPPAFEAAVKEWVEGSAELPYMQKVVNFVTLCSGVRELAQAESLSSHFAQELAKLLDEHAFMRSLVSTHASHRIDDVMTVLRQSLCHEHCATDVADEADYLARVTGNPLDELGGLLFGDLAAVSACTDGAAHCFLGGGSFEGAAHERALLVLSTAVSALGPDTLRPDFFEGFWNNAVADNQVQKALGLCRVYGHTTSLAICLCFALTSCREMQPFVATAEGTDEQKEDLRCFVALKMARQTLNTLRGDIDAKLRFYPEEQQVILKGMLTFCKLAEAAVNRFTGVLTYNANTSFAKHSQDLASVCPNWMPLITQKTLNMSGAKKMLMDGDAIAAVSSGVRKFCFVRQVLEDGFRVLKVDFAMANQELYETAIDNEIHARLTVALKTAIQILANGAKNPRCQVLISEFHNLITKQNAAIAKLTTQRVAKTKKSIQLPASIQEALSKLSSGGGGGGGSSGGGGGGGGGGKQPSSSASSSAAKRPRKK